MTVFLWICDLLIPAIMIGIGLVWRKNPPKDINNMCGYRTERAMKNNETWIFAQQTSAKVFLTAGMILLVISIAILIVCNLCGFVSIEYLSIFLSLVQCGILILSIIPVESALKKHFDDDGFPKQLL
jgi:uncharacterized membrane protein